MVHAIDFIKELNLGWSSWRELWDCWVQLEGRFEMGLQEPVWPGPTSPASPGISLLVRTLPPQWRLLPRLQLHTKLIPTLETSHWLIFLPGSTSPALLQVGSFGRNWSPRRCYLFPVASLRNTLKEFSSNPFVTSPHLIFLMEFMVSEIILFIYGYTCLSSISSCSPSAT